MPWHSNFPRTLVGAGRNLETLNQVQDELCLLSSLISMFSSIILAAHAYCKYLP